MVQKEKLEVEQEGGQGAVATQIHPLRPSSLSLPYTLEYWRMCTTVESQAAGHIEGFIRVGMACRYA